MSKKAIRLYENEGFQTAANEALRPGGLELTKKAMEIAGFAGGSRILDIGSGCGKTVEYLTEALGMQSSGIDISEQLAVKAKRLNSNLEVVIGDVCRLPFSDGSMNGVICECIFNLLDDRMLALAQMHRVLAQSGKLVISDLYLREKKGEFSGLPIATCINGITTRENTIQEVTAAGFQLIEWQDETQVYKEFVAGLIIKYGSMAVFWESMVGSCDKACDIKNSLRNVRIGYYLSVWNKSRVGK